MPQAVSLHARSPSSVCTVPSDIDHERFSWVREAADEFVGLLTDKSIRAGR